VRTTKVWDAANGQELLTVSSTSDSASDFGEVLAVALSQDNKRLVAGGSGGTATVWDTATGREIFTLRSHSSLFGGLVIGDRVSRRA
jgi:WD40 repeat protein